MKVADMLADYRAARKRADELTALVVEGKTQDDEVEKLCAACDEVDCIAAAIGRIVAAAVKEAGGPYPPLTVRVIIDKAAMEEWLRYRYEHGGCKGLCTYEQYKAGLAAMHEAQKKDRRCCE